MYTRDPARFRKFRLLIPAFGFAPPHTLKNIRPRRNTSRLFRRNCIRGLSPFVYDGSILPSDSTSPICTARANSERRFYSLRFSALPRAFRTIPVSDRLSQGSVFPRFSLKTRYSDLQSPLFFRFP